MGQGLLLDLSASISEWIWSDAYTGIDYKDREDHEGKLLTALRVKFPQASFRRDGRYVWVEQDGERIRVGLYVRK